MKFALVFLTFFVLVEVYNARHLHGLSVKESWPLSQVAVIQMVIGEEKLPLLQSTPLSSSYEHATNRRVSIPPTPKGQATYSRVPMPPQSPPRKPPPQVQLTYIRVNPPKSSPPGDGPPPEIQKSDLEDKPNLNNERYSVAIEEPKGLSVKESWPLSQMAVIQMVTGEEKLRLLQSTPSSSSYEHTTYRRVSVPPPTPKGQETYSRVPMPPQSPPRKPPPQVQLTYIRVNPPESSSPDDGPSPDVQKPYLKDKPNLNNESYSMAIEESKGFLMVEASPKQDSSMGQSKYGRDDPTKPPSPDPSDSQGHGMLGRINPSEPAATKSADPTHPLQLISDI